MKKRFLSNLLLFLAMGLGLICGFFDIPFLKSAAQVSSEIFLRLLKLISLPIIFLSITSTITSMNDFNEMRKMGRKTLFYTIGTTLIAATIALLIFVIVNPTKASSLLTGQNPEILSSANVPGTVKENSYFSFLINIIPSNLLQVFIENNVLGVAFIAFLVSIATLFLEKEQKIFLNKFFSSLFAAMLKITHFIILLIPVAIWAFVTLLIKDLQTTRGELSILLVYILCVVGANLVQGLVVLPLLLKFKKISPLRGFKMMAPALSLAFFSKSSSATLPVTMRSLERGGISRKIASFTVPLCSVINMNGCAAFILTTTLFVSMLNGIVYTPIELVGWIFLATLAAIGNAGVPMGCFFLTSAFLIGMDVPLYWMGLILPFYTVMDMIETALNVWSDGCITMAIDKDLKKGYDLPLPASTAE